MAEDREIPLVFLDAPGDLAHGAQDARLALLGGQQLEGGLGGQLDVDAHPVAQKAQAGNEAAVAAGDGFGMDIPGEAVFLAENVKGFDHLFGGLVGGAVDGRAEEQAFDVIAAVEVHGELGQLAGGEGGPGSGGRSAVRAVAAVIGAVIAEKHFQQGDAPAIGGKGMADALGGAGARSAGDVPALGAAGGAGHIVFGGVGEDAEFLEPVHKTDLLCVRKFEQMFVRYGYYSIRTSVLQAAASRGHTALPRWASPVQKGKDSMAVRTPDQRQYGRPATGPPLCKGSCRRTPTEGLAASRRTQAVLPVPCRDGQAVLPHPITAPS